MSSRELRDLARRAEAEGDPLARARVRIERARAGEHVVAEAGDLVLVTEENGSQWVWGQWRGFVTRQFDGGDRYVRPLAGQKLSFRCKPSVDYITKGLYLTRDDACVTLKFAGTYDASKLRFSRGPFAPKRAKKGASK